METLVTKLTNWVAAKSLNGIKQHEPAWHEDRKTTIGGSSIALLQTANGVDRLIKQKIGIDRFDGNIMTRWGNLFEDVAKTFTETQLDCKVVGEDLYVRGPPGVAYSPDGLAVITKDGTPQIVLLEFKCPYSRTPTNVPPKQYIPQVKMGLDVIDIAEYGLLIETTFKRRTLHTQVSNVLAIGLIGFYYPTTLTGPLKTISQIYTETYSILGLPFNDFVSNDLSTANDYLFNEMMRLYLDKKLAVWYGDHTDDETNLAAYVEFCKLGAKMNLGVLPWQLIDAQFHTITRSENYLQEFLPAIKRVVDTATKYNNASSMEEKQSIFPSNNVAI